jgi:hypothetical protein
MTEQQHEDPIRQAAAALGKRGGEAGRGAAKRRTTEHYQMAGRRSVEVRRLKKQLKDA